MELEQERSLIEQAKQDPSAFGALFDEYYRPILNYCVRRTGSIEIGEDLAAETFFKAYKKLWQFRWRNIPFAAWLYRIANNEITDYFRKKKTISLEELAGNGFDLADRIDLLNEVAEAERLVKMHKDFLAIQKQLALLSIKYQEVIALRFFEDKQIKEIAEILGKKEGTIKSLLSRGLEKLRTNTQPISDENVVFGEGHEIINQEIYED